MAYELKHYYRVKYALVCTRQSFLKDPPKDDYEEYARKVIARAYFLVLNKIDELDGTNERLLNITGRILKNAPKYAIIKSERRYYNEKSINFFIFTYLNSYALILSGELVW